MRLCIRHQLEWSAVQSPSSCITDKNKKIHLKNIIQQIDGHLGFSVNFKSDQGWLRSNVFNYWEIKTRLILLRSSPAVSPQLHLGCRGRWEAGLGAGSHWNPAPPGHGPSRRSLYIEEAPRKAGAPAVHRHAYHRTALRGDAVLHDGFDTTTSTSSLQKLPSVCSISRALKLGPGPPGSSCGCKQASNSDRQHHFTRSFTSSSWLSFLILQPAGPHHLHPLSLQSKDRAKLFVTELCTLRKRAASILLVALEENLARSHLAVHYWKAVVTWGQSWPANLRAQT